MAKETKRDKALGKLFSALRIEGVTVADAALLLTNFAELSYQRVEALAELVKIPGMAYKPQFVSTSLPQTLRDINDISKGDFSHIRSIGRLVAEKEITGATLRAYMLALPNRSSAPLLKAAIGAAFKLDLKGEDLVSVTRSLRAADQSNASYVNTFVKVAPEFGLKGKHLVKLAKELGSEREEEETKALAKIAPNIDLDDSKKLHVLRSISAHGEDKILAIGAAASAINLKGDLLRDMLLTLRESRVDLIEAVAEAASKFGLEGQDLYDTIKTVVDNSESPMIKALGDNASKFGLEGEDLKRVLCELSVHETDVLFVKALAEAAPKFGLAGKYRADLLCYLVENSSIEEVGRLATVAPVLGLEGEHLHKVLMDFSKNEIEQEDCDAIFKEAKNITLEGDDKVRLLSFLNSEAGAADIPRIVGVSNKFDIDIENRIELLDAFLTCEIDEEDRLVTALEGAAKNLGLEGEDLAKTIVCLASCGLATTNAIVEADSKLGLEEDCNKGRILRTMAESPVGMIEALGEHVPKLGLQDENLANIIIPLVNTNIVTPPDRLTSDIMSELVGVANLSGAKGEELVDVVKILADKKGVLELLTETRFASDISAQGKELMEAASCTVTTFDDSLRDLFVTNYNAVKSRGEGHEEALQKAKTSANEGLAIPNAFQTLPSSQRDADAPVAEVPSEEHVATQEVGT